MFISRGKEKSAVLRNQSPVTILKGSKTGVNGKRLAVYSEENHAGFSCWRIRITPINVLTVILFCN